MRLASSLAIVLMLGGAAVAAGGTPTAAEKALWCGSAFNWLARDADDAADPEQAAVLDAWSRLFTDLAVDALRHAGYRQAAIEAAIATSDHAVLAEMQEKRLRYDVESCPALESGAE